jgi:hypothetical protein
VLVALAVAVVALQEAAPRAAETVFPMHRGGCPGCRVGAVPPECPAAD